MTLLSKPEGLTCEAPSHRFPEHGDRPAAFIYGPECELETGKLMYLCKWHAKAIADWIASNPNRPVECPTHGIIGTVKSVVVLKEI
jgi:hypothetical protein